MKKIKIGNCLYDVIDSDNVQNIHNRYQYGEVAVQFGDQVYPYIGKSGTAPGFYATNVGSYIVPSDDERYSSQNILDFDKCENVKELIQMNQCLKDLENEIINSSTDLYTPKINEEDTPEMIGLREAIIQKKIDIDKYQDRFGASFNNDKRILSNSNNISFQKIKSISDNLDINLTLIIEDKPGAANPIGKQLSIPLNYIREDEE